MTDKTLPIAGPWITEAEIALVTDAVRDGWYDKAYAYTARFEEEFAACVGRKFAMATPSCTSAIHLLLAGLGIGPGDEVIVPELTWIASAAPISYVGATVVFADTDRDNWCLTAESIKARLTDKTRAVIVVDLYGNMPDMDAIERLCKEHNIALIEDAAEAIGSSYKGRKAGAFGVGSTFSFHGTKTLTTGEGGMLVTDDEDLFHRCRFLSDHGRSPTDKAFNNREVAFKYKMSNLQAAIGLAQLRRLDDLVGRKREIFQSYVHGLKSLEGLSFNPEPEGVYNSFWMSTVVLGPSYGMTKYQAIDRLKEMGIDTRPFFNPLSGIPAYHGINGGGAAVNPSAYATSPYGINLPSALCLEKDDIARVCEAMKKLLA